MNPDEFHPNHFGRGRKYALDLELGPAANGVNLPVLLIRGNRPGKTLVVTAGVHGDEFEGVRAVLDVYQALAPEEMSGDFLSVPLANPPAFWRGTRTSPLDGADLARVFPGDLEAGPTSIIAYNLAHSVIVLADFYLDLHSGGVNLLMPSMVGYDTNDARSREAARIFGARVHWGHPSVAPGRTISFSASRKIPWLYTEARGAGGIDRDDLQMFTNGIRNLLCHLGTLPGTPVRASVEYHLCGEGNTDASLLSSKRGFFISHVELLQEVSTGEELGWLIDLHGEKVEMFLAPCDGVVTLIRRFPSVEPGVPMFLVTKVLSPEQIAT